MDFTLQRGADAKYESSVWGSNRKSGLFFTKELFNCSTFWTKNYSYPWKKNLTSS